MKKPREQRERTTRAEQMMMGLRLLYANNLKQNIGRGSPNLGAQAVGKLDPTTLYQGMPERAMILDRNEVDDFL